jgi:hypothetical protein
MKENQLLKTQVASGNAGRSLFQPQMDADEHGIDAATVPAHTRRHYASQI